MYGELLFLIYFIHSFFLFIFFLLLCNLISFNNNIHYYSLFFHLCLLSIFLSFSSHLSLSMSSTPFLIIFTKVLTLSYPLLGLFSCSTHTLSYLSLSLFCSVSYLIYLFSDLYLLHPVSSLLYFFSNLSLLYSIFSLFCLFSIISLLYPVFSLMPQHSVLI